MQFATGFLACGSGLMGNGIYAFLQERLFEQMECQAGPSVEEFVDWSKEGGNSAATFFRSRLGRKAVQVTAMLLVTTIGGEKLQSDYPMIWKRLARALGDVKFDSLDVVENTLQLAQIAWTVAEQCVAEKSLAPLTGLDGIYRLESTHATLQALHPAYLDGTYRELTGKSPAEHMYEVRTLLADIRSAHAKCNFAPERLVLHRMMVEVQNWSTQIEQREVNTIARKEPFSIFFTGTTGVGKSSASTLAARDCLRIMGEPCSDQYLSYLNVNERFDNTTFNHTKAMIIDDLGQIKPEYADAPDLMHIIRVDNNARSGIPKADLQDKGRHFYNPDVLVVSSNTLDLNASTLANEPSAFLRRFNVMVSVTVAPGYEREYPIREGEERVPLLRMVDPAKLTEGIYTPWQQFQFLEVTPLERKGGSLRERAEAKDEFLIRETGPKMDYSHFMQALKPMLEQHAQRQKTRLHESTEVIGAPLCPCGHTTVNFCHVCSDRPALAAAYRAHVVPLEQQAGGDSLRFFFEERLPSFLYGADAFPPPQPDPPPPEPDPPPPRGLMERVRSSWDSVVFDAPVEPPTAPPLMIRLVASMFERADPMERLFLERPQTFCLLLFALVPSACGFLAWLPFSWLVPSWVAYLSGVSTTIATSFTLCRSTVMWVKGRIARRSLGDLKRMLVREGTRSVALIGGAIVAALTAAVAWRLVQNRRKGEIEVCMEPNGGCSSVESREPAPPDRSPRENIYANALRPLQPYQPPVGIVRNMTEAQQLERLKLCLFVVEVHYVSGQVVTTQGMMVQTNYLAMPAHNFFRASGELSDIRELVCSRTSKRAGPHFRAKVGASNVVRASGDLAVVRVDIGGTQPNFWPFIANAAPTCAIPVIEMSRVRDGNQDYEVQLDRYIATPGKVFTEHLSEDVQVLEYTRSEETFKGLCGALLVTPGKAVTVVGMHAMGGAREPHLRRGAATLITRQILEPPIAQLRANGTNRTELITQETVEPFIGSGCDDMAEFAPLRHNSCLREAPEGAPMLPIGTLANLPQVKPKTYLQVTPVVNLVTQATGEECKFGPPKNLGKKGTAARSLQEVAEIHQLDPDVYAYAMQDRLDELNAIVAARSDLQEAMRPLSLHEAINGVQGCSSINRVNLHTAMGFPYNGTKEGHVRPDPRPGEPDAVKLSEELEREFYELEDRLASGVRPNVIFKAAEKDEATRLTKEKVRFFKASPFIFALVVRKYFRPILRMYGVAPLATSSAVGMNAYSAEWDALTRFLKAYDPQKVVIGDYKHYDTSLAYQEVMAAFTMWIQLAKTWGEYSDREITIMWCIAEEIARSMVAFNSDLVEYDGTNPSGCGITVEINNEANCLRSRHVFYGLAIMEEPCKRTTGPLPPSVMGEIAVEFPDYRRALTESPLLPGLQGRFADYVRAIFYGDDVMQTVRGASWFNQLSMSAWLDGQGKAFTSADKSDQFQPYTPWRQATFLKRGFRYDADVRRYMAPLEMDSIYKPLFVIPKDLALGMQAHYAQVIYGACREFFQHGREVFEERVPGLWGLAANIGARGYLPSEQPPTYDQFTEVVQDDAGVL